MVLHAAAVSVHASHDINRRWWNEVTPVHVRSGFYRVDRFLAGEPALDTLERGGFGVVRGRTLLHLQCHFGLATLSWARDGALAVGADFSEVAIAAARDLAEETQLTGRTRFVCADVLELDRHLDEKFDCVFTSYGVLTWLSDLRRWARMVAHFLKPDGRFYMVELHPASMVYDQDAQSLPLRYPYFHSPEPIVQSGPVPDYADPTFIPRNETHEWQWSLSDIFNALWGAGLEITEFNEYPYSCYRQFPRMDERADGFWHLPEGTPAIPLLFSVAARHKRK